MQDAVDAIKRLALDTQDLHVSLRSHANYGAQGQDLVDAGAEDARGDTNLDELVLHWYVVPPAACLHDRPTLRRQHTVEL